MPEKKIHEIPNVRETMGDFAVQFSKLANTWLRFCGSFGNLGASKKQETCRRFYGCQIRVLLSARIRFDSTSPTFGGES